VKCYGELAPEEKMKKGGETGTEKPLVNERGSLASGGLYEPEMRTMRWLDTMDGGFIRVVTEQISAHCPQPFVSILGK